MTHDPALLRLAEEVHDAAVSAIRQLAEGMVNAGVSGAAVKDALEEVARDY